MNSLNTFDEVGSLHSSQVNTRLSSSRVKTLAASFGFFGFCFGGAFVWLCASLMRQPCPICPTCPHRPASPACPEINCRNTLYETLTGNSGHILPEMYGKVKEKTIWLYWNTPGTIPDFVQLCIESIQQHKGSFDVRLIYKDEVGKYVSFAELPYQWGEFRPAQQKDSLMNALLARYGGIALDATVILFESFDSAWDNMVSKGVLFQGYMYGKEETAVWCMMARRETLFRSATIAQVIGAGDATDTNSYEDKFDSGKSTYFAFGDRTITPIINMYDYSRGPCFSPVNGPEDTCYPPRLSNENVGPELGREKLIINDPVEGPHMWFCADDFSCGLLKKSENPAWWSAFEDRRQKGVLPFVKLFQSGGDMKKLSRAEILAEKDSFAMHWLCLANVSDIGCSEVM